MKDRRTSAGKKSGRDVVRRGMVVWRAFSSRIARRGKHHPQGFVLKARRVMNRLRLALRSGWVMLAAFPVVFVALLLDAVQAPLGPRLVRWLRATWAGDSSADGDPGLVWWLRALLLASVSFAVSAYLILGVLLNLAYPLRPDVAVTDWGGPTLLGRWAVHATGGVLFALVGVWLLPALHALARRWL
jgi:hypothetical protein